MLDGEGDSPVQNRQDNLVEEFCERARDVLRNAPDRRSAQLLAVDLCAKFSDECMSDLIVNAARGYIERWINDRWRDETDAYRP